MLANPLGHSPQSCLANTIGALTPVTVPHARAPTWGRGRQLQPHKEGEQKGSVRRQRRSCAEGVHKRQETPRKVWHNGVGNENFALGFPRTHPMGKMKGGNIFLPVVAKLWETGWHSPFTGGKVTPPPPQTLPKSSATDSSLVLGIVSGITAPWSISPILLGLFGLF